VAAFAEAAVMLLRVSDPNSTVGATVAAVAEAIGDHVVIVGVSKAFALAEAAVGVTVTGRAGVAALAEAGSGVTDLTTYLRLIETGLPV